jgi:hypothetical protein
MSADNGCAHALCGLDCVVDAKVGGIVDAADVFIQAEPVDIGACVTKWLAIEDEP